MDNSARKDEIAKRYGRMCSRCDDLEGLIVQALTDYEAQRPASMAEPLKNEIAVRAAAAQMKTIFGLPETAHALRANLEEAAYRALSEVDAHSSPPSEGWQQRIAALQRYSEGEACMYPSPGGKWVLLEQVKDAIAVDWQNAKDALPPVSEASPAKPCGMCRGTGIAKPISEEEKREARETTENIQRMLDTLARGDVVHIGAVAAGLPMFAPEDVRCVGEADASPAKDPKEPRDGK
jgi:hypothetical protein